MAILSHRVWQHRFDSNLDIVGQTVLINDFPFTVIGVAPEELMPTPHPVTAAALPFIPEVDGPLAIDVVYPPEEKIDLEATYKGKVGQVRVCPIAVFYLYFSN